MQAAVFTGGPNIDTERVAAIVSSCEIIYAADSGAEPGAAVPAAEFPV